MTQTDIDQILSLVHEGNKLAAVKLLMDSAHIGLKEAKDIIDDVFLGKETDINERVKRVSYSDTAERFTAESGPNGENPHFFYHKGSIKEEVTPAHPMKGTQTTQKGQAPNRKEQASSDKKDTLFIKKSPFDFLKWYFYLFIAAAIVYMIYLFINH